jgi:predicted phosphodiesterase
MRYALLADIHGNLPALEAVLDDIRQRSVDQILIAGDLACGCPFPRETLDLLRSLACPCIRGNNETYLLKMRAGSMHPDTRTCLSWGSTRWTYAQLSPSDLDWIAALPEQLSLDGQSGSLRLVHGSPRSENEGLIPGRDPAGLALMRQLKVLGEAQDPVPLSEILALIPERVLVCGHYHVPWMQREDERLVVNPGSVGVSTHGQARACYALLEDRAGQWNVEFFTREYDIRRCSLAYETSGLLAAGGAFARAYRYDVEHSSNLLVEFLVYASGLARARGQAGRSVIPDDVWLEAEQGFAWPG